MTATKVDIKENRSGNQEEDPDKGNIGNKTQNEVTERKKLTTEN